MSKLKLSEQEKRLILDYKRTSPLVNIRLKCEAVFLYDSKVSVDIISGLTERSTDTVYDWIKAFKEYRLAFLVTGHKGNQNASKLTREQKLEIAEILRSPPSEFGLPKQFWDVPQLKEYVEAKFEVVYESRESYHFLLKFGDLSFKYPDGQSPRKNQEFTEARTKEIREEVTQLKKEGYFIYTADETRLQYETEIRRAWLPKGKRTIVKTERSKEHQNYLGFLNQDNGQLELYEIEKGNQENAITVLEKLMTKVKNLTHNPDQRVCVVWDNARWHKGKELRKKLKKGQFLENLHLINFAPYSPETNPIEHVWNWAKNQISNRNTTNFQELKQEFETKLQSRTYEYWI